MPKPEKKSLRDYFTKMKKPPPPFPLVHPRSFASNYGFRSSSCKQPKTTPSVVVDNNPNTMHMHKLEQRCKDEAASLADIDAFLVGNYKSLYGNIDYEKDNLVIPTTKRDDCVSPLWMSSPPDQHLRSSSRFFVPRGSSGRRLMEDPEYSGRPSFSKDPVPLYMTPPRASLDSKLRFFMPRELSGSLYEESGSYMDSSSVTTKNSSIHSDAASTSKYPVAKDTKSSAYVVGDKEQILDDDDDDDYTMISTSTRDPVDDFRRAMQAMVEARLQRDEQVNWRFMVDLLLRYFNVNEKKSYEYILCALVDLILFLRNNADEINLMN